MRRGVAAFKHAASDVVEVVELQQVTILDTIFGANILMLMVVVFPPLREANRSKALFVERTVVAATSIAIQTHHHHRFH